MKKPRIKTVHEEIFIAGVRHVSQVTPEQWAKLRAVRQALADYKIQRGQKPNPTTEEAMRRELSIFLDRRTALEEQGFRDPEKIGGPRATDLVDETLFRQRMEHDSYKCFYCGADLRNRINEIHMDHYIPRSRGGKTVFENLRTSCRTCNLKKHDKMPDEL